MINQLTHDDYFTYNHYIKSLLSILDGKSDKEKVTILYLAVDHIFKENIGIVNDDSIIPKAN